MDPLTQRKFRLLQCDAAIMRAEREIDKLKLEIAIRKNERDFLNEEIERIEHQPIAEN